MTGIAGGNDWGRPEGVKAYDNHTLSAWRRCPREGYFSMHRGLSLYDSGDKSSALLFGTIVHGALDILHTTRDVEKSIEYILGEFTELNNYRDKRRTPELACEMLAGYAEFWANDMDAYTVLSTEQYFEFPLWPDDPSKPWYNGLIDNIREKNEDKVVGGIDFKTSSQMRASMIETMRIRGQFIGYYFWLKRFSQWKDRVGPNFYADYLLTAKNSKYGTDSGFPLRRERIHGTSHILDDWLESTRYLVEMIEQIYLPQMEKLGLEPPMNTDSCERFNYTCPFYSLCSQPKDTREMQIKMSYSISHWDPSERD